MGLGRGRSAATDGAAGVANGRGGGGGGGGVGGGMGPTADGGWWSDATNGRGGDGSGGEREPAAPPKTRPCQIV